MECNEDIIYHYCSAEIGKLILATKQLKFSNPLNFNDPFDCSTDLITLNLSQEDLDNEIKNRFYVLDEKYSKLSKEEQLNQIQKEVYTWKNKDILNIFDDILIDTRMLCLSTQYKNILMWSHYGDKHKGMCIGFDKEELLNSTKCECVKINYNPENEFTTKNLFPRYQNNALLHWISNKSKHWEYEKEVRVYTSKKDNPLINENDLISFDVSCVKEVYLGCKSNLDINILKNHFRLHGQDNVSIKKLNKMKLKFELE